MEMSAGDDQVEGCEPPEISGDDLYDALAGVREKCALSGQFTSDEDFDNTVDAFESAMTNTSCFVSMCEEFEDPSLTFMKLVFEEAARCAHVDLILDDCIFGGMLEILMYDESSNSSQFRRSLQGDMPCSRPSYDELQLGVTLLLAAAQQYCPETSMSTIEFNEAVSSIVTILGSPGCFGQPMCEVGDDDNITIYNDDTQWKNFTEVDDSLEDDIESEGIDPIDIGIKFIEQCVEIEFDHDDCLVSTIFDIMKSNVPREHRSLEVLIGPEVVHEVVQEVEEDDDDEIAHQTGPTPRDPISGVSGEALHIMLAGARHQCLNRGVEYSEEEYEIKVNKFMTFFGADECWISLYDESQNGGSAFHKIMVGEIAVCAGVQVDALNQCLWDQFLDDLVPADEPGAGSNIARRMLQAARGNETHSDDDGMCYQPDDDELYAELSWFLGNHFLMNAGQKCAEMGEEFGQADIDIAFTELTKLFFAPHLCTALLPGGGAGEGCDLDIPEKKSQDEIESSFVEHIYSNAVDMLKDCAGVHEYTCVLSTSLDMLTGMMQSCAPPSVDESNIHRVVDKALQECLNEGAQVNENDHHLAIDYLFQIVSKPQCWEDICQNSAIKNRIFSDWMISCSWDDFGFFYHDDEIWHSYIAPEAETKRSLAETLDTNKLKCIVNHILVSKVGDEVAECSIVQISPNVCETDFTLALEAYIACSGDDEVEILTEHPTLMPSPSPTVKPSSQFSMSYSFEEDFVWEDVEWDKMPKYELSFSYSFDDVITSSMSMSMPIKHNDDDGSEGQYDDDYSYDDDSNHNDDDDDDDTILYHPQVYAYLTEVCTLLNSVQYNPLVKSCVEPICEIDIESALVSNSNYDEFFHPTAAPSNLTTKPVSTDTMEPTLSSHLSRAPTKQPAGSAETGTHWPTAAPTTKPTATTNQPTSLKPTIKPTLSPSSGSSKPTVKPTTSPTPTLSPSSESSKPTVKPTTSPTPSPTKAQFGSVDVKFDAAVTLTGITVSDLNLTALGAVVDLLEKVITSLLPANSKVRLLKVGGISVTRRMLRFLEDAGPGVDVEFEITVTKQCDDAKCNDSESISAKAYQDVTSNLKTKVEDGSLTTAIQEEASAEGVPQLANVSIKPDSLKASEPKVIVREASTPTTSPTSASPVYNTAFAVAVLMASIIFSSF
jgi:hypothetical protein